MLYPLASVTLLYLGTMWFPLARVIYFIVRHNAVFPGKSNIARVWHNVVFPGKSKIARVGNNVVSPGKSNIVIGWHNVVFPSMSDIARVGHNVVFPGKKNTARVGHNVVSFGRLLGKLILQAFKGRKLASKLGSPLNFIEWEGD